MKLDHTIPLGGAHLAYLPGTPFHALHKDRNNFLEGIDPNFFAVLNQDHWEVWERTHDRTGNPNSAVRLFILPDPPDKPWDHEALYRYLTECVSIIDWEMWRKNLCSSDHEF